MLSEIRSQKDKYTSTHSSLYGGSLNQLLHIPMDDSTKRYSNLKLKKRWGRGKQERWDGAGNSTADGQTGSYSSIRKGETCVCVCEQLISSFSTPPSPPEVQIRAHHPIPRLRPRCQVQHRGLNTSPLQILLRSKEYFLPFRNKSLNGSLVNSSGTYSSG